MDYAIIQNDFADWVSKLPISSRNRKIRQLFTLHTQLKVDTELCRLERDLPQEAELSRSEQQSVHRNSWSTLSVEELSQRKDRVLDLISQLPWTLRPSFIKNHEAWEAPWQEALNKLTVRQRESPLSTVISHQIRFVRQQLATLAVEHQRALERQRIPRHHQSTARETAPERTSEGTAPQVCPAELRRTLTPVELGSIDPYNRECPICFEPYDPVPTGGAAPLVSHDPVQLSCGTTGHIFGRTCITHWLNEQESCPLRCGEIIIN